MSYPFRRNKNQGLLPYRPPQQSELEQWITGQYSDNPTYPDKNYYPDTIQGAYILEDTVPSVVDVVIADRLVFNNEGLDWIDLGRPDWLDKLNPSDSFTACIELSSTDVTGSRTVFSIADGSGALIQLGATFFGGNLFAIIGGAQIQAPAVVNTYYKLVITCDGVNFYMYLNGVFIGLNPVGSYVASSNLFVNARASGPSSNFEGQTWSCDFYEGYTEDGDCSGLTPIEKFALDDFTGGQVVGSVAGTIGTVTDGTPITSQDKGIAYKIEPNASNKLDTTGGRLPAQGVKITKEEWAAYNNGDDRNIGNQSLTIPQRTRIYKLGTSLTPEQKEINRKKVFR